MSSFSLFEIIVICVVIHICIYSLVDRICKCVENGHVAKTYQARCQAGFNDDFESSVVADFAQNNKSDDTL